MRQVIFGRCVQLTAVARLGATVRFGATGGVVAVASVAAGAIASCAVHDEPLVEPAPSNVRMALTGSRLPLCVGNRDGLVYYVWEESVFRVCDANTSTWVPTDLEGSDAAVSVVPLAPGAECAAGGFALGFGLDLDRNGVLDPAERTSTANVCHGERGISGEPGADGTSSLLAFTEEPAGTNCEAGGARVETGLDANGNDTLDPAEVIASQTQYVCNGVVTRVAETTVGGIGTSCSIEGALGCADFASQTLVMCAAGVWVENGSCGDGEYCDTTLGATAGSCRPAAPGCDDRNPGDSYCVDRELVTCGPDLVTVDVFPCPGPCAGDACQEPVVLASGQRTPYHIVVDATSVYWTNAVAGGELMKVSIDGGTPTVLATSARPYDLAIDSSNVYWTNSSSVSLLKIAKAGGSTTTLSNLGGGGVEVYNSNVYWSSPSEFGSIYKLPVGGGTPTTLASTGYAYNVAVDASSVYYTMYYDTGWVTKVPLSGGTPVTLNSQKFLYPVDIAVNPSGVYWASVSFLDDTGYVMRVGFDGGTVTTLASTSAGGGLTVHGADVYFADTSAGTLSRVSVTGGDVVELASGQDEPMYVAADANSIYWTNMGDGTLMKLRVQ